MIKINNRNQLPCLFESVKKYNKGVEVGTFQGEYSKQILKSWTGKLYIVDVWRELDVKDYNDSSNQKEYLNIINECCQNIKGFEDRCFMIRSDSENSSELFNDESLDFVYIDANHKYEYVKQDISLWFPKVRKGGIIAGHDYLKLDWYADKSCANHPKDKHIWIDTNNNGVYNNYAGEFGVNPAVDEFCAQNNYKANITDEWFGSWYFIK
jgi:hypothetical protein